jgi:spore coat protein YutH
MKNIIYYYYNIKVDKINNSGNYYYFYYNNYLFFLLIFDKEIKYSEDIYALSKSIVPNIMHSIIKNNKNEIITYIDNNPYVLLKINFSNSNKITIKEISDFSHLKYFFNNNLLRDKWNILWSKKIDYLEYQINQVGRKYPVIVDSFSYFIGLAENAISYYKNTIDAYPKQTSNSYSISHDILSNNYLDFYNPLNIIIDHKSRDIAEYIKLSFYNKNYNIFEELDVYFKNNFYSEYDMRLLVARILYPSLYFNIYDSIINNLIKEEEITYITGNINEYENYLRDILIYLEKYYKLPGIDWLAKNRV